MIMTHNLTQDWRNRRLHPIGSFPPIFHTSMHYSIANYHTGSMPGQVEKKADLNEVFASEIYMNQLNMLPNPLQKNLADTLPTETKESLNMTSNYNHNRKTALSGNNKTTDYTSKENSENHHSTASTGFGSFISSVFSVITAAIPFQRRGRVSNNTHMYQQRFETHDASPPLEIWPTSNQVLNKNHAQSTAEFHQDNITTVCPLDMDVECKSPVEQCEEKLAKVKLLLSNKNVDIPPKVKKSVCRPRRFFVPPGAVEEVYEDALEGDDLGCVQNSPKIEFMSIGCNINEPLSESAVRKIKVEMCPISIQDNITESIETTEIAKPVESKERDTSENNIDVKSQIIASCEDKVNKLKELLAQRKRNKEKIITDSPTDSTESIQDSDRIIPTKKPINIQHIHSRKHKNPNRLTSKRTKCQLRKNINEDMKFANEIDGELSSVENSPRIQHLTTDDFNEVTGRFRNSSTTESEDSFQIVFSESPQHTRTRKLSDCDSEDSFIVFEDNPDSCYTSGDVFGDYSDSDSDNEPACPINNNFSRTVSDLTDDSLYEENGFPKQNYCLDSEDELDCAVNMCQEISSDCVKHEEICKTGQSGKRVRFSTAPPTVRVMRVWSYAARQARAGHWEQHARDRERFKRKIADIDAAISWVLTPQHRNRIKFQRFMPWWHAQRRQETADRKAMEQQIRMEEEQRRMDEETKVEEERKRIEAMTDEEIRLEKEEIRLEQERIVEEQRMLEEERRLEEMRILEEKKMEEARLEEERRLEQEALEEEKRIEEEKQEQARIKEEKRIELEKIREAKKNGFLQQSKVVTVNGQKKEFNKKKRKDDIDIDKFVKSSKVLSVITKIGGEKAKSPSRSPTPCKIGNIKSNVLEPIKVTRVDPAEKLKKELELRDSIVLKSILKNKPNKIEITTAPEAR